MQLGSVRYIVIISVVEFANIWTAKITYLTCIWLWFPLFVAIEILDLWWIGFNNNDHDSWYQQLVAAATCSSIYAFNSIHLNRTKFHHHIISLCATRSRIYPMILGDIRLSLARILWGVTCAGISLSCSYLSIYTKLSTLELVIGHFTNLPNSISLQ